MNIKYKLKDNITLKVPSTVIGFVVFFTVESTINPEKYELLRARFLELGYQDLPEDRSDVASALGATLKDGKMVWTNSRSYPEREWYEVSYETFMTKNIKFEREGEDQVQD